MGLTVALSGDDTLVINNQTLTTLSNQDPATLEFPNDVVAMEQGKNGSVIYAQNNMGFMCDLTARVLLAGVDDKYLNSVLQQQISAFSDFSLITGTFYKRVGDGNGNISTVVYQLSGGAILKGIEAMTSANGNVNQSNAIWRFRFGLWVRSII